MTGFINIGEIQKGTEGRGREKNVTTTCDNRHDNLRHVTSRVGSRLSVGAGPTFPSAWRGHCAEVQSSPRGECELTPRRAAVRLPPSPRGRHSLPSEEARVPLREVVWGQPSHHYFEVAFSQLLREDSCQGYHQHGES